MKLKTFLLSLFTLTLSLAANAAEINLYDLPNSNAKPVGTIDMSVGVIPIFTSKDGVWVKVGDPRNGNVGWIKANDLNNAQGNSSVFSYMQRIINDGNNANSYQFIQLRNAPAVTPEQAQKLQVQQQVIQQSIQRNVQDMMNGMQNIFQWKTNGASNPPTPPMPIVVFPVKQNTTAPKQPVSAPAGQSK